MKMYTGIKALTVMFWITFMFGKPCVTSTCIRYVGNPFLKNIKLDIQTFVPTNVFEFVL